MKFRPKLTPDGVNRGVAYPGRVGGLERRDMDKYVVAIGSDVFDVDAGDHQGARYDAASQFRKRYQLNVPLGVIADRAKARAIPKTPDTGETTEDILKELKVQEAPHT